jgi:hypothetical protein
MSRGQLFDMTVIALGILALVFFANTQSASFLYQSF